MRLRERSFHDVDRHLLGVFGLALVGGIVALALAYSTLGWFQPTYVMSGSFTDAAGLRSGSAVVMAGVDIGRVTAIDGDFERGHVTVTWEVDRDVDLGADTRAELSPSSLFGGYAVRLSGPVEAPLMADLPVADRHLDLDRTSVPAGLTDVLDTATSTVDALDTDTVTSVVGRVSDLVTATEADLVPLLEGIGDVADLVEAGSEDLVRLAEESRTLTALAIESEEEIVALSEAATTLLDELETRRDQLERLLGEGHLTVARLSDLLADQRDALERLTTGVSEVVAVVESRTDEVNHGLALLGPAIEGLASAGNLEGEWVEFVSPSFGPISGGDDDILRALTPLTELDLPEFLRMLARLVGGGR